MGFYLSDSRCDSVRNLCGSPCPAYWARWGNGCLTEEQEVGRPTWWLAECPLIWSPGIKWNLLLLAVCLVACLMCASWLWTKRLNLWKYFPSLSLSLSPRSISVRRRLFVSRSSRPLSSLLTSTMNRASTNSLRSSLPFTVSTKSASNVLWG